MANSLTIIKLGGSLLTDKSRPSSLRLDVIRSVVQEIKACLEKGLIKDLILVHGVGSIGHPLVYKHKLHYGFQNEEQLIAMSQTQLAVNKFRLLLSEEFSNAGLPINLFHPSSMIISDKMAISQFCLDSIKGFLDIGMIPLLGGDMLYDKTLGFSVGNGDNLVTHLANEFHANQIIFATDVAGIYNKDPKTKIDAKKYSEISIQKIELTISQTSSIASGIDVSGAMKGKLLAITSLNSLIEKGSFVNIISMMDYGNLLKILSYEKGIGTTFIQ